jgi:hypothetical protein
MNLQVRNVSELYIVLQMATNISKTLLPHITHFTTEMEAVSSSKRLAGNNL